MLHLAARCLRPSRRPLMGCRRLFTSQKAPPVETAKTDGASKTDKDNDALTDVQTAAPEAVDELQRLRNSYLVLLADMENLRARTRKEVQAAGQYAVSRLARDVINVVDVLEMALRAPEAPQQPTDDLRQGIRMTLEEAMRVLGRHGVTPIEALGSTFDPNLHEALYEVERADAEPGTVIAQEKRGFLLHDRVLRPAQVGVSKRP